FASGAHVIANIASEGVTATGERICVGIPGKEPDQHSGADVWLPKIVLDETIALPLKDEYEGLSPKRFRNLSINSHRDHREHGGHNSSPCSLRSLWLMVFR